MFAPNRTRKTKYKAYTIIVRHTGSCIKHRIIFRHLMNESMIPCRKRTLRIKEQKTRKASIKILIRMMKRRKVLLNLKGDLKNILKSFVVANHHFLNAEANDRNFAEIRKNKFSFKTIIKTLISFYYSFKREFGLQLTTFCNTIFVNNTKIKSIIDNLW